MNIIKVKSKSELKEVCGELEPKDSFVILISEILKIKNVPKSFDCYLYDILIPSPSIINVGLSEGYNDTYEEFYRRYLSIPDKIFFLNKCVQIFLDYDKENIVLACSADEVEYKYIDILCDMIKEMYGIKPISAKKFLAGKRCKVKDKEYLKAQCTKLNQYAMSKMKEAGIDIRELLGGGEDE